MGQYDETALGTALVRSDPPERSVYRQHRTASKATCTLLAVWMLIELFDLINDLLGFLYFANLNSGAPSVTIPEFRAIFGRADIVRATSFFVHLVTAGFFLRWSYLASNNAHALTEARLRHTKESAVWWWFVPFANFFKPYLLMSEAWNASTGALEVGKDSPGTPAKVLLWWVSMAISGGMAMWDGISMSRFKDPARGAEVFAISMISDVLLVIWGVTAFMVVKGLTDIQDARHRAELESHAS